MLDLKFMAVPKYRVKILDLNGHTTEAKVAEESSKTGIFARKARVDQVVCHHYRKET